MSTTLPGVSAEVAAGVAASGVGTVAAKVTPIRLAGFFPGVAFALLPGCFSAGFKIGSAVARTAATAREAELIPRGLLPFIVLTAVRGLSTGTLPRGALPAEDGTAPWSGTGGCTGGCSLGDGAVGADLADLAGLLEGQAPTWARLPKVGLARCFASVAGACFSAEGFALGPSTCAPCTAEHQTGNNHARAQLLHARGGSKTLYGCGHQMDNERFVSTSNRKARLSQSRRHLVAANAEISPPEAVAA